MTYHCEIGYSEAQDMPLEIRRWWIKRVSKELEKKEAQPKNVGPAPWNRGGKSGPGAK